jgi:hypothetical protein
MHEVEHTLAFGCCKFHAQSYGDRKYASISLNGQRIFKLGVIDLIRLKEVVEHAVDYTDPMNKVKTSWFYIIDGRLWVRKTYSHSPIVIGFRHHERVVFTERKYLELFRVFLHSFLKDMFRRTD